MEESSKLTIKEWAEDDRPRERLLSKGAASLSNADLLAILIGSGTTRQSAVELMREVMRSCGDSLRTLGEYNLSQLCAFNGIGTAKAVTIMAAIELGRRRLQEFEQAKSQKITCSTDIHAVMRYPMMELGHEEFWCLLLNNANILTDKVLISRGGITETAVDIRLILRAALLGKACSMILCHNHPSGNLKPSQEDIRLTHRVKQATDIMGIRLLDHVIISPCGFMSFADEQML